MNPIVFFVDANLKPKEVPVKYIESQIPGKVVKTIFATDYSDLRKTKDKPLIQYFHKQYKRLRQKYESLHAFFITNDKRIPVEAWYQLKKSSNHSLEDNFHLVVVCWQWRVRQQKSQKWHTQSKQDVSLVREKIEKKLITECRSTLRKVPIQ